MCERGASAISYRYPCSGKWWITAFTSVLTPIASSGHKTCSTRGVSSQRVKRHTRDRGEWNSPTTLPRCSPLPASRVRHGILLLVILPARPAAVPAAVLAVALVQLLVHAQHTNLAERPLAHAALERHLARVHARVHPRVVLARVVLAAHVAPVVPRLLRHGRLRGGRRGAMSTVTCAGQASSVSSSKVRRTSFSNTPRLAGAAGGAAGVSLNKLVHADAAGAADAAGVSPKP